jgi:hypothetical protein
MMSPGLSPERVISIAHVCVPFLIKCPPSTVHLPYCDSAVRPLACAHTHYHHLTNERGQEARRGRQYQRSGATFLAAVKRPLSNSIVSCFL